MFASEGINLEFTEEALRKLAQYAFQANSEVENIGARRLQTVMSRLLNDLLFEVPDVLIPPATVTVDVPMVEEKLKGLIQNRDLSQYIL